jgi:hypothetical protein
VHARLYSFLGEMKMNKMKWTLTTLAASLLIMTFASAADATVLRAFVSSTGADANTATNCAQTAPCKTFNAAIAVVTAGGELIALDTAGYGPIANINKAITIATVPGATAFVVAATGTAGFTINGAAGDLITLRNINFNGSNAASTTGIQYNSGKLVVQNCTFQQLTAGLTMAATFTTQGDVTDSTFTGNTKGVNVFGGQLLLDNCRVFQNTTGVSATGSGGEVGVSQAIATNVRLSSGMVTDNGTGFEQLNAGTPRPSGSCNSHNIFLRSLQGTLLNIVNNTLNVAVNAGSDPNAGCSPNNFTNGTYTSP